MLDRLMRPKQLDLSANNSNTLSLQLEQRMSFDIALVVPRLVSIAIPLVTMGLTWPWTGPVVPATIFPYLVGIVVQFKYEQIARYWKSPSWVAIPFIFHVRPILIPSLINLPGFCMPDKIGVTKPFDCWIL